MPSRPLEELSAIWIATLVEGAAVIAFLTTIAIWAGVGTGRL